jgi:hypothetical protein
VGKIFAFGIELAVYNDEKISKGKATGKNEQQYIFAFQGLH